MRKFITKSGLLIAALLICGAMAVPSAVFGAEVTKPYKIKGSLFMTPRAGSPGVYDFVDTGTSTQFGKFYNVGWLAFNLDMTIAAGAGICTAANGDYNTWVMEANTGRVISTGGVGRFAGVEGGFKSEILTMVFNEDGTIVSTYIGEGSFTYPRGSKATSKE